MARVAEAVAEPVTADLRPWARREAARVPKANAVSQKCSGLPWFPALPTRLQLARVVPLVRLELLRRRRQVAQLAAAAATAVRVAIQRLVPLLLGAELTTLLRVALLLVHLVRRVPVVRLTKAATFYLRLVVPVARQTRLAVQARADTPLRGATERRLQTEEWLAVRQLLPAAAAVELADKRRQTATVLRRQTVAQVARLVPMARLVLRAALLPTVAAVLVAVAVAAAGRLPLRVLKVVLAVLVALALTDT